MILRKPWMFFSISPVENSGNISDWTAPLGNRCADMTQPVITGYTLEAVTRGLTNSGDHNLKDGSTNCELRIFLTKPL